MADPNQNTQAGVPIGDGIRDSNTEVATGDRRSEKHYEADPDQIVRIDHSDKPDGPLPPQERTSDERWRKQTTPPVQAVTDYGERPSVWDARPADGEPETPDGER